MRTSVLIPFENAKASLPALLKALAGIAKKRNDLEFLFVDRASSDDSRALIEAARLPASRVLIESHQGLAEALNLGLSEARGENILLLVGNARPAAAWAAAMEAALGEFDLVVGSTLSQAPKKGLYGQLAARLFTGHSARTARAQGHALPWGPADNLAFRRGLLERVGIFSAEAGGACDIDWCWRALLKGAKITFAEKAEVSVSRESERGALLRMFEGFGQGEAWLHRTYAFLLSPEDRSPDPLISSVEAFSRLRYHSQAAKVRELAPALEEVATAFACGVRVGYERPHRQCPLERELPKVAISWKSGKKAVSVFVPGKGLAQLEGKPAELWEALQNASTDEEAVRLCMRLFHLKEKAAAREVHDFRQSLSPES
jgi:glycosyltransferase involved in cell wall biosynthesis